MAHYVEVSEQDITMARAAVTNAWENNRDPHPLLLLIANAGSRKADPFITVAEIASRLGVSKMHVYRLLRDGAITSSRFGRNLRVRVSDFQQYVQDSEIDLRGAT